MLLDRIKENPFLLAPMAGITDIAFRTFMRRLKASVVTTELVSANGLKHQSNRTRQLMKICEEEKPVGIQIFGENLESLAYTAKECEKMGATFVDLNFGCPVNKVVKKGAGSAVLKDLKFMTKILKSVKKAVSIPVTIKIRTGWNEEGKNAHKVTHIAYNEGITWVAIHGRTRAQAYNGKADWEYIKSVYQQSSLPIIGNGDLTSAKKAISMIKGRYSTAIMIGRGALKNPWIFKECLASMNGESFNQECSVFPLIQELYNEYLKHFEERVALLQVKKFSSWFSSGYPHSSQFRKKLFSSKEPDALWNVIIDYFSNMSLLQQKDTNHEAFLMGGHG